MDSGSADTGLIVLLLLPLIPLVGFAVGILIEVWLSDRAYKKWRRGK